ncbi:hypothetical protein [Burkholderia sp. LMG 21824]|uniref:hypothetical protein n=1 Tax=Burkholderia sp. LMG 21824 TaxID=3158172 RepID=UPI003C2E0813
MRSRHSIFEVLSLVTSSLVHAATTYRYGKGRVGLVGRNPEADESGYRLHGLKHPDGVLPDMACDLINATMKP